LKNAALHSAIALNVTEILREAGPNGLHASEIAKKCDVDENRIGRLLRTLSINQCYREVSPDVFANTRISSVLDTGKSVAEIQQKPEDKHERTSGFVALVEHQTGDVAKMAANVHEYLTDPVTARSPEPFHSPFNRAFNFDGPFWAWFEAPEQSYRRRRFAMGMYGVAQMQSPDIFESILDWEALPKDSVVVDVGGGIGTSSALVARRHVHLKFIVQDFASVCEEGKKHWSTEYPEVINDGRLSFIPHDFFTAQPVTNASVFILKQILHNWSDPYCFKILKALRDASRPDTKLVIIDGIVAYGCHDPTIDSDLNTGYKEAPAPLLPNYGGANSVLYFLDLAMMAHLNGQERTVRHLDNLLLSTGWKLVKTERHEPPNNFYEPMLAVAI